MELDIALVAVGTLGALVVFASRTVRHLPVSEPLIALVLGVVLGPDVTGLVRFEHGTEILHGVSEVVMAIALMAIALRFPWPVVVEHRRPAAFMVLVGMAAMAAVVAGLAGWLLGVGVGTAVLLGGILAPTDPVLSSSVVTGLPAERALPERLRALLSVESGINDGLALPIVVAGIVLLGDLGFERFAIDGLWSVAVAVVLGAAVGTAAGATFNRLDDDREIEHSAFFVFTLVLAVAVLGLTNLLHGDGILAVFVAGLAYNRSVGEGIYEREREVDEGINRVLVLPAFMLFGSILPWERWDELGAPLIAFTVGVLVLRRLPFVLAARTPLGMDLADATFYGWFGPMGVAALYFVTLAQEHHATSPELWPAASLVVAASTLVHGVTAAPGRQLYTRVVGERGDDADE